VPSIIVLLEARVQGSASNRRNRDDV